MYIELDLPKSPRGLQYMKRRKNTEISSTATEPHRRIKKNLHFSLHSEVGTFISEDEHSPSLTEVLCIPKGFQRR